MRINVVLAIVILATTLTCSTARSEEWGSIAKTSEDHPGDPLIDLSSIVVKGKYAGVLGKPPFRADVTRLLRAGPNDLIVRVANLWPNRLIGDKQPNAVPVAFTTFNPYNANLPLMDSGLLGPVAFLRIARGSPRARH